MICTAIAQQSAWSDDKTRWQNSMMADKDQDGNNTIINASINASAMVPYLMIRDCHEEEKPSHFGPLTYTNICQICQWYAQRRVCADCCPPKDCRNQWVPVGDPTSDCQMLLTQIG